MRNKCFLGIVFLFYISLNVNAQIPSGYYNSALGLSGVTLKTSLHNIIKSHTSINYSDMDVYFTNTDKKPNGKVWDIYSFVFTGTQPYEYSYGVNECGNYNSEADCFNKEHTWPQSYFNQDIPMRSDFFHIYPTDGWVNNKRANFPYGKVTTTNWTSQNGSKLGTTNSYTNFTTSNSNHYVFEPLDSFKGDIARSFFYMTTRYQGEDAAWDNWEMANKAELTTEAITLLMQWHHNDPVSTKEKDRNEAIFAIQHNRNPFIDFPEFADCIWGTGDCSTLPINNLSIQNSVNLFPNPAFNFLNIETKHEIKKVKIYTTLGNMVLETNEKNINIHNLRSGFYYLEVVTDTGVANSKFLKQ